jgi:hypothetical protein
MKLPATVKEPLPMSKSKPGKKKAPKRVLALPDLEWTKMAVLNSLTSTSGQHTYDHAIREFVIWYCSEPRLRLTARSCFDIEFTSNNVDMRRPRLISGWPPSGASRTRQPTSASSVPNWQPGSVA